MRDGIAIVDNHAAFRAAVRQHLQENSEFKVIAEFRDGHEFLAATIDDRCGIVLLDISMPRMDGLAVLTHLPNCHPQLRAIIVSGRTEEGYKRTARETGAAGFVSKDAVYSDLIPCIRKVLAGESWFPDRSEGARQPK